MINSKNTRQKEDGIIDETYFHLHFFENSCIHSTKLESKATTRINPYAGSPSPLSAISMGNMQVSLSSHPNEPFDAVPPSPRNTSPTSTLSLLEKEPPISPIFSLA